MQRWYFMIGRLLAALALIGGVIPRVEACGPSWSVPKNHFDGVNEYGYVSYWEKIGSIDLGQDLSIPLIIGFRSNREWSSPYLGQGWILALLDSQFIPVDENNFQMTQPDGWVRSFGRKNSNDKVLEGQGDWKAEIKADMITAWATCGWKFAYTKGKISSITTPKNRTLTFIYTGDRISEVQDGGFPFLRVESDPKTGAVTGLVLLRSKQRIGIEMGSRPCVQCVKKENVVSGGAPSLRRLTLADQTVRPYTFDVNEQKQPMLKIGRKDPLERAQNGNDRVLVWDVATKMILADDDWTYEIKPAESLWTNAAIRRKNSKGQKEFWHYDAMHGRETVERLDGATMVKTWFTSGILTGRVREIVEVAERKTNVVMVCVYDEKGRILSETNEKGVTTYLYDAYGHQTNAVRNGYAIWSKQYDNAGRVVDYFVPKETDPKKLAELRVLEDRYLQEAEQATNQADKDTILQTLGLFYVHGMRDVDKAREILSRISSRRARFCVELHAVDHDPNLKLFAKIGQYKVLLIKFPEEHKVLVALIELRNREMANGSVYSL